MKTLGTIILGAALVALLSGLGALAGMLYAAHDWTFLGDVLAALLGTLYGAGLGVLVALAIPYGEEGKIPFGALGGALLAAAGIAWGGIPARTILGAGYWAVAGAL